MLLDFCDAFNLKNIIQDITCHVEDSKTLIDHIFTNKPRSCLTKGVLDKGISDIHGLIYTALPGIINAYNSNTIYYRSFKHKINKYKHDHNKSTYIRRASIKGYFHEKCNKGRPQSMSFWKTIKPF